MGRRKIEIKPIKDDRNRSVTFLKRKGGLFKKAHELSVLCSVDVAVIIFGQNRKCHTYSSGDLRETLHRYHYYQGPHEDKGPADFADKDAGDDDEEDEPMGSPGPEEQSPPQNAMGFPGQPLMHHLRHGSTPQNSPPIQNGLFGPIRTSSPQPQGMSRPTSVNQHRRISSNLVPQNHPYPQAAQQQNPMMPYGYPQTQSQNQAFYQSRPGMQQMHSNQSTPLMHQGTPPMHNQQHAFSHPAPPQSAMQAMYLQEQRRQSMPPNYSVQLERPQSVPNYQQGPQQHLSRQVQSPPMPGSPRIVAPVDQITHIGYTPIDDSRSMLVQQWGRTSVPNDNTNLTQDSAFLQAGPGRGEHGPRSHSVDISTTMRRHEDAGKVQRPPFAQPGFIQRARSPLIKQDPNSAQLSPTFAPGSISRVDSMASDAKRPRLTVQIPAGADESEGSAAETGTSAGDSRPSAPSTSKSATASTANDSAHGKSSSVVLPPPSPSNPSSATMLSPGATGPTNPFARPPPPRDQQPHPHHLNTNLPSSSSTNAVPNPNATIDTPTSISALPSRFMSNDLLPSPNSFYPEYEKQWSAMSGITSPSAMFQPTPVRERMGAWGELMDEALAPGPQVGGDEIAELERKMKRKVISPTEGGEERGKRGRN